MERQESEPGDLERFYMERYGLARRSRTNGKPKVSFNHEILSMEPYISYTEAEVCGPGYAGNPITESREKNR